MEAVKIQQDDPRVLSSQISSKNGVDRLPGIIKTKLYSKYVLSKNGFVDIQTFNCRTNECETLSIAEISIAEQCQIL